MRARLAYFAIVTGGLGIVFLVAYQSIFRLELYYKYKAFGLEDQVDGIVRAHMRDSLLWLATSGVFSIASMAIGIALLRRCHWSRNAWLVFCGLSLGVSVYLNLLLSPAGWRAVVPIGFRILVLVVSLKLLRRPDVKSDFVGAKTVEE